MSISDTVNTPSSRAARWRKVSGPSDDVRIPSAAVRPTRSASQRTMCPTRSDSAASAASSGSTPSTRASGRSALTALATPDANPPPPMGTSTVKGVDAVAQVGELLHDLQAARALARDDARVVVGGDEHQTALARQRLRDLHPFIARWPDPDDLRAVRADARHLDRRSIRGHDDDGRDAQQAGGARHALGVVARRVRHDTPRPLLRRTGWPARDRRRAA